jgi:predicted small lipoprotein YifL
MLRAPQILVSVRARRLALAACVVGLVAGCGQKGPLTLPTGEGAVGRATVIETITPDNTNVLARPADVPAPASSAPPSGTASPVRTP